MIKKLQVVLIFRARCISSLSHDSITDFPWGVVDASECQVKTWNFRRIINFFLLFSYTNWFSKLAGKGTGILFSFDLLSEDSSFYSSPIWIIIPNQWEDKILWTVGKNNYLLQNFSLSNQFIINFGLNLSYIYIGILNSNNN